MCRELTLRVRSCGVAVRVWGQEVYAGRMSATVISGQSEGILRAGEGELSYDGVLVLRGEAVWGRSGG